MCPGVWPGAATDGEPRHDLLVHFILLHILGDGAEDAAGAEEAASHVLGSLVHAGIVHPERPFGGRNQHFGVREDGCAVLAAHAIDVIAVEVADDDCVDLRRVEAGGAEILHPASGRGGAGIAVARIDQGQAAAIVQNERGEAVLDRVLRQERIARGLLDGGQLRIADEAFERTGRGAVIDGRHFDIADLVAVEAGGLARRGALGRSRWRSGLGKSRPGDGSGGKGSAGKNGAACDRHERLQAWEWEPRTATFGDKGLDSHKSASELVFNPSATGGAGRSRWWLRHSGNRSRRSWEWTRSWSGRAGRAEGRALRLRGARRSAGLA